MKKRYKYPSVLTIAGFDGSGGAGIQGDMKTISALGCYATTVLTALPIQNTCGVKAIHSIPAEVVLLQIETIMEDILPDAIKIGMVHTTELVEVIATTLKNYPSIPIVLDPVMVASSGDRLIEKTTIQSMIEQLFPLVTIITPNLDEAAILIKRKIQSVEDMKTVGMEIMELGCNTLLLKGGHLKGQQLTSLFFSDKNTVTSFISEKIETSNTHGSGCTLSSAIASFLAQGKKLSEAVALAEEYVHQAIVSSADVHTGKGNGPLNHFFNPIKLIKNEII